MNLLVIGDSYSIPINKIGQLENVDPSVYTTNWINIVAKGLNAQTGEIESDLGVSNEWIYYKLLERLEANPNREKDYIIIQTTAPNRHWFFEDAPYKSNILYTNKNDNFFTKQQINAINHYLVHLQNDNLDGIIYNMFIRGLEHLKLTTLKNSKVLILPGWAAVPGVKGNLTDNICDKEFNNKETAKKFYIKNRYDPRLNHMTLQNHQVLADKIIKYFLDNTPLDLTTGFYHNLFTENNI